MTKEEYLALAADQWEAFSKLDEATNFYDYEKKFDGFMVNFGRELLNEKFEGDSKDRRQKKSEDPLRSRND